MWQCCVVVLSFDFLWCCGVGDSQISPSNNKMILWRLVVTYMKILLFLQDDRKEGMVAFAEKRKANFTDN